MGRQSPDPADNPTTLASLDFSQSIHGSKGFITVSCVARAISHGPRG